MDPVQFRFIQLLIVEILGVILCLGGLVLLFLGASGKIGFLVQGPGLKARLTNGSPGLVIALIGVILIAFSLKGSIKRETTSGGDNTSVSLSPVENPDSALRELTEKAKDLQSRPGTLTNAAMKDAILGTEPVRKIVSSLIQVKKDRTLGEISQDTYGKPDYWPLIGAINFDRNYYDFRNATADTLIKSGSYVEIWKVSRYFNENEKTIVQLSEPAIAQANQELLERAQSGAPLDVSTLQDEYKARELDLEYSQAQTGDLQTLRELAIKYYGDAKFWPILIWTNQKALAGSSANSPIPRDNVLFVLHFIP